MEKLKFISEQMAVLDVPYEFGEWTSDVKYPYFVGEITEIEPTTEDGAEEASFILTGFHRGKYIELEEVKERIKKHFHTINGICTKTENGAVAVYYGGAFFVPSGEADLKKIQITLKIKTWKGAN